jgi:hypothetical protein
MAARSKAHRASGSAAHAAHAAHAAQATRGSSGARTTAAAPAEGVQLPRRSKGRRPEFYDDPAVDQLFAIVTALTAEISVAFDRLDTLERVLVQSQMLAPNALESFQPDALASRQRSERRDELLRRVFAVLEAYAERQRASAR